jgi:hypothetical protein
LSSVILGARAGDCYNRAVSPAGRRRVGIVVLTLLFAAAVLLSHGPFDLGSIRVEGVNVLWWYALGLAPALAVLTAAVLLLRSKG